MCINIIYPDMSSIYIYIPQNIHTKHLVASGPTVFGGCSKHITSKASSLSASFEWFVSSELKHRSTVVDNSTILQHVPLQSPVFCNAGTLEQRHAVPIFVGSQRIALCRVAASVGHFPTGLKQSWKDVAPKPTWTQLKWPLQESRRSREDKSRIPFVSCILTRS